MPFELEGHVLDPARRELRRSGVVVPMEPQVFDLLLYLVRNRERLVSKDDLIADVWNGRIVSESTLASRINAARRALGDDGKQQRFIRTAARRGIRFVGEVREQAEAAAGDAERRDDSPSIVPLPPPIVDRPSIAVLPFENLSEDRTLELLADGLVEDVIALLARVAGFFVIARASSFIYRPMATEVRQIGMELGVRYVVTGSIRGSEGRVRVTAQLIEAESATQLWAARYDVERGDTLDLQDRIAREIITELEPALTRAELSIIRRRRTDSVDAWSHYRRALGAIALEGLNEETVAEAVEQLRQAILADAEFALARALLARVSTFGASLSLIGNAAATHREAFAEAERAVAMDPNDFGCARPFRLRAVRPGRREARLRAARAGRGARPEQCAGARLARRRTDQPAGARPGNREHAARHAPEPARLSPGVLGHDPGQCAGARRPARGRADRSGRGLPARRAALRLARRHCLGRGQARTARGSTPRTGRGAPHPAAADPRGDRPLLRPRCGGDPRADVELRRANARLLRAEQSPRRMGVPSRSDEARRGNRSGDSRDVDKQVARIGEVRRRPYPG